MSGPCGYTRVDRVLDTEHKQVHLRVHKGVPCC